MSVVEVLRPDGSAAFPVQGRVKIGFILLSHSRLPEPSTRVAVLNMFPYLRRGGFDPHIVFEPQHGTMMPVLPDIADSLATAGFRVVVFQKVHGASVEAMAYRLRERGIRTLFSVCDQVVAPMVEATDATIAVTEYLASLYPAQLRSRIHVVHDGIERRQLCKSRWRTVHGSPRQPLDAVLVTSANMTQLPVIGRLPDWLSVTIVGRYPKAHQRLQRLRETHWTFASQSFKERRRYLAFLMHRRIQRVAWEASGVYDHLLAADIGIIPIDPGHTLDAHSPAAAWRVKSENRLTLKMAVGLPVVATPIPAYEQVIEHGVNGFFARTAHDWHKYLLELRDPELRRAMGARARTSVLERFGQTVQAQHFVDVLHGLLAQPGATPCASGALRINAAPLRAVGRAVKTRDAEPAAKKR